MTSDAIDNWIERARQNEANSAEHDGACVAKRSNKKSRGDLILEISEKLRPWLTKMYEDVRDENGMIVQPSRVRGIALNVAQLIVQDEEKKISSA